jgi:outer membrane murein-binding lipoprotein Lpp
VPEPEIERVGFRKSGIVFLNEGFMKFLVEVAVVAGAYVAGCVSPAVGRKLKAELAKGKAELAKIKAEDDAYVKSVEKKF